MNLNQVTVEVSDIPRARAFYQKLGLEWIVSSDHYARFLCPGGATFSIHLAEASAPGGTMVYFECDDLDDRVAALRPPASISTATRSISAGSGARPACATPTAIACACISPARTGRTRHGGSGASVAVTPFPA